MDVVLCHRTADFDALGAAVGWTRLRPGARIVLCGGTHPTVRDFLALYRDEYPLIERRSVVPDQLSTLAVVDTQRRALLNEAAEWLDLPQVQIQLYDHHTQADCDIAAHFQQIEPVGAATTLIVEQLQAAHLTLSMAEATVMALGIHVDTGSLTYDHATVRDAAALTWLMGQGANQKAIATYTEPGFSVELQDLLGEALPKLQTVTVHGNRLASVMLESDRYVPGLSSLTAQLMVLSESDALLLGHWYQTRSSKQDRLTVIGRSRIEGVDLAALLQPLGGGGHAQAAAATLNLVENKTEMPSNPTQLLGRLIEQLQAQIPPPLVAAELMSAPVRTILLDTTIDQARRILLRYGHSGLSVMDEAGQLVGILSRRDLDIALHHGFGHAPVKGYMTAPVRTITPQTPLPEIENLMVTYDIGRLPVVNEGALVGIVTRTDILRQLHHLNHRGGSTQTLVREAFASRLDQMLAPKLHQILTQAAAAAQARGWQLYLVGGAVRDLLLAQAGSTLALREFDLVVDGVTSQQQAAGVDLARSLEATFGVQLQVYGQFQTASLLWPEGSEIGAFAVDIATARSEFYPYPAANPEVSASSIRQDLYRRDFTVNALAVRLTPPGGQHSKAGELLDFFGGLEDLEQRYIRVLHPNSFIEDPTRIFRAVRFATRLGFNLEPQTESYIHTAIASGIYAQIQHNAEKAPALQSRLRNELKSIFKLMQWPQALKLMASLGALQCLHRDLVLDQNGWRRIQMALCWLKRFDPQFKQFPPWLMILETLLLTLPDPKQREAAQQLHLPELTQQRFAAMPKALEQATVLDQGRSPSQVVQHLKSYDLPLLIEVAIASSVSVRRQIWRYLDQWSAVRPLITGADLIRLGYRPGPDFKIILEAAIAATLDGDLSTQKDAISWVLEHFPQS
ncbi:MAG: CBS domain-containing protein [Thermosynechococcaceae cyanobacterium MS004]|nr:CBS domain-containing protein [Thermosynechococcaceae cyanobacterium MS004]